MAERMRGGVSLLSLAKGIAPMLILAAPGFAQQVQGRAVPSSYDVVSIRLESEDPPAIGIRYTATGFEAYAVTLTDLVKESYGLPDARLVKGAANFKTKYHIVAKLSENDMDVMRLLSREQAVTERQKLLQSMLADRFQVAVHHEKSPLAIYSLEVSAHGLKLQAVTPEAAKDSGGTFFANGRIKGVLSMEQLAHIFSLSRRVDSDASDRTVVDGTGLRGQYPIDLAWTGVDGRQPPMVSADTEVYGSATAALEQVGLRLVPKTIDVDSIVVDHAVAPDLD